MVRIKGRPMFYCAIRWRKFRGTENLVIGAAYRNQKTLSYIIEFRINNGYEFTHSKSIPV